MARRRKPSLEQDADLVTVRVAGRAALPVRAIPFLTCWQISPDEVASQLARLPGPPFAKLRNTHAYHLIDEKPVRIRATEWRQVVSRFEALEARIRRETPHEKPSQDPEGYARWSRESVSELPPGVFVWRDEFERDFASDWDQVLRSSSDFPDQALSYAPMALRDQQAVVFEGFRDPPTALVNGVPPVPASATIAWQEEARRLAKEIIDRDRAKKLYPSQMIIAEGIARELEARGIYGPIGKPLSAEYIKRHVLKGITSGVSDRAGKKNLRGK